MRAQEIRQVFLDYFAGVGHTVVRSSALVPDNDPTLFFTNAGMVQFKNVFLGQEPRGYSRAATAQKCLRVTGKHNDLEAVGRTPRHHTFFEMLGNFSFGDYFKKDAIAFAWELLTRRYGLPADRLVATVFREDDEAARLWTAHLPSDRIFRFDEADNFWAMGDSGPCGPCSELHFDWHPERGAPTAADINSGRFWEVWNLVFMQYNQEAGGRTPLAKPSIDTGMGLERITAILQGQQSNYETDLFRPLLRSIEQITQRQYTGGETPSDVSMRVIADHIRATCFLIADGVLPSNEGRGYVLRRIMRRAIRHGKLLGQEAPFFYRVAPVLRDEMAAVYPELAQHHELITTVIQHEEARFYETLAHGLAILTAAFEDLRQQQQSCLPGELAFKLYDTYGFPKDLTDDIAAEQGMTVDTTGFEVAMERQRERARSAWKGSGAEVVGAAYQAFLSQGGATEFVGDDHDTANATVRALVRDGVTVNAAQEGERVEVLVDRTPFYGESGGQVGDTGQIQSATAQLQVEDTVKPLPGLFVHRARVTYGTLRVGDTVTLTIDVARRAQIRRHHTATHLLHRALRGVLGEHVKQAGSLVAPDRLRFDFAHFAPITAAQIQAVEDDANRVIQANVAVQITQQAREAAIAAGAMAFFGEKYGEVVRVVAIPGYSTELCGGMHVQATGDIGGVKIVAEGSVAAGVRRMEALSGQALIDYVRQLEAERHVLARLLKVTPQELLPKIKKLTEQVKQLERDVQRARTGGTADLLSQVQDCDGVKLLSAVVPDLDPKTLREVASQYQQKLGTGIVALGTAREGKASVIVMVSSDLTARYHAGELIKRLSAQLGGTGGGRPDMAQGGGPNVEALAPAMASLLLGLTQR